MIEVDEKRGNIRVVDDRTGYRFADVLDLGDSCAIHSDHTTLYTPTQAAELGRALIVWANTKRAKGRQAIRDANNLPAGTIVRDDGTWLAPDKETT